MGFKIAVFNAKERLRIGMKQFSRIQQNSLFQDSFWALFGSALGKGLSMGAGIAIARFLGKEIYGEYGLIRNTLLMIAIFSSFGLGYTATKFIAECKFRNKAKIHAIHRIATFVTLLMSCIIGLLLVLFAETIASCLDAAHLTSTLRQSAIAIVFNAINITQTGELAGFNAYKTIAFNSMISGIWTFVLSILLTYFYRLDGAVIALTISLAINCLLNCRSLKKILCNSLTEIRIESTDIKEIVSFSLPIALQESLYSITYWAGTFLLIKLTDFGELGLSSAAGQWMAVLLFVPSALRNVALSHLSETNGNANANRRILNRLLLINFFSTFVPFLFVALFSQWISSWYGPSYTGLQSVLNVCIFTTVINSLTNVYTQELMAHSQNWYLFFTRLLRDCGILVATYFAIITYGHGALTYAVVSLIFQSLYLILLWGKYHLSFQIIS